MKTKDFSEHSELGIEFIELWNKQNRDGANKVLSKHFGFSICKVYHIRKKLNLQHLHSLQHPGRKKLIDRIKKHYFRGKSTLWIGSCIRMNRQNVANILKQQGIKLRKSDNVNVLLFPFKNLENKKLIYKSGILKQIKEDYIYNNLTIKAISIKHNLDQGAISNKLKSMGIQIKGSHKIETDRVCEWCNQPLNYVNCNNGIKRQRFHQGKCNNMAKDYRRGKGTPNRFINMNSFLLNAWGKDIDFAKKRILTLLK